jgi:NAD(P)-dependent dehydrogenase (short-subunit alcohol dehydrogenase family)
MRKLEGKSALITFIDDGIGLATAKQFVNEGAYVFITGHRAPELIAATEHLGSNVTGAQVDVSNLADLDRLFAQIKQEKDRLDIIFVNTGTAEGDYDSILYTHVKGLFFIMQKALPLMTNGASIILNTSFVSNKERSPNLIVAAATAAMRAFGRTWAMDLRDRRIRVNVVSPNFRPTVGLNHSSDKRRVDSQRSRTKSNGASFVRPSTFAEVAKAVMSLVDEDSEVSGSELLIDGGEAHLRKLSEGIVPGKPGTPDEIAQNILYLASDDSRHLTGIELFVDRGTTEL